MPLSLIVPMLNEAEQLPELLTHLQHWQQRGREVLLVDGGSTDETVALAEAAGFTVLPSARGRALQMNAGAEQANGEVLLFLHADTLLPDHADELIRDALTSSQRSWGRFDVRISGKAFALRFVSLLMNWRSRLSGIATGDQAIFVHREIFEEIGGFPDQPLMEDIELSRQLLRYSSPVCLKQRVTTSGRRWEERGCWRAILLMWRLRWAYWRGASADKLAEAYR